MNTLERRIGKLEKACGEPDLPVRQVILEPHENLDDVCAREGIDPDQCFLIVRQIVVPSGEAKSVAAGTGD